MNGAWRRNLGRILAVMGIGLWSSIAGAGGLASGIHAELATTTGWTVHDADAGEGIRILSRPIPSLGLTAFRGELEVPVGVSSERLWSLIGGIEAHIRLSDNLAESRVFSREGLRLEYYQVLKPPPLLAGSTRFWVNHSAETRAINGNPNHHRRCWSNLPVGEATAIRADIQQRFPGAIEVPLTHGCWEIERDANGKTWLRYTTVSDPGGSVPPSLAKYLSARTLPENMLTFVRAARGG